MKKKITKNKENELKNERRRMRRLDRHTGLDWIDPENGYGIVRGEQALWRAVILQMLEDAVNTSPKRQDVFDRNEARIWLEGNHKDFYMVCDLAGFDISYVKRHVKKALMNGCKWRKDKKMDADDAVNKPATIETKSAKEASALCEVLSLSPFFKKSA